MYENINFCLDDSTEPEVEDEGLDSQYIKFYLFAK